MARSSPSLTWRIAAHLLAWLGDMGVNYMEEMDDTDCTMDFRMRSSLESQDRWLPIHRVGRTGYMR